MYKLGKTSPLTGEPICIYKIDSNLSIPLCADNTDYQAYLAWVAEGNEPLPAITEGNNSSATLNMESN